MQSVAIIPARMGSTRLPGKALAEIGGTPMVVRVWQAASRAVAVERVLVATDDPRVVHAIEAVGGEAVLTPKFSTGTDRVAHVAARVAPDATIINVQGDMPFLDPLHVDALVARLRCAPSVGIATLAVPLVGAAQDPALVKVVCREDQRALYFSREPIPRGGPYRRHIGVYAFRAAALRAIAALPPGHLERAEDLEQLRWLEAGFDIAVEMVEHAHPGVDTVEQLTQARALARRLDG